MATKRNSTVGLISVFGLLGLTSHVSAQSTNVFGMTGLLEMPSAEVRSDGMLTFGMAYNPSAFRSTLGFQIAPRLSGAFRYSGLSDWDADGSLWDRSFDLKYQLAYEGKYTPAVAVGLQDFIGTGIYSGEYVVASKTFGSVVASAGLGWGRLGSYNSFENPFSAISDSFSTRPTGYTGTGGQFETARWFRGDTAMFAGLTWHVNDKVTLKAEYSSDAQVTEVGRGMLTRKSPLNFGLDYRVNNELELSAYALHGSEVGVMFNIFLDPKNSPAGLVRDGSPLPVQLRGASARDLGWAVKADAVEQALLAQVGPVLDQSGFTLEGVALTGDAIEVRIRNRRFSSPAQAVGRTARILSNVLPASVETFTVVLMERGIPMSKVVVNRTDLEELEHAFDGSTKMLARSQILDAADVDRKDALNSEVYSDFTWRFGPYVRASLFDPDSPIRLETGAELAADWNPTPGLYFSGALRQRVIGNLHTSSRASDSVLDHVRTDGVLYDKEGAFSMPHLTATYLFRPAKNTYGRVTAGYLERMYGGVSSELLWKPVNSKFALGLEVNAVKKRSFDQGFGFSPRLIDPTIPVLQPTDSYPVTSYSTVTGHLSGYYQFDNGMHLQMDVGRYLAGDWGTTITVDRRFSNGWKVGAYATFTDVSADDFGEGSFDKGIRLEIPLAWQLGTSNKSSTATVIQPLTRDGGAKLRVEDRLYDMVRGNHGSALNDTWGRFWR